MPLGPNANETGLFPKSSRFNHSCCANAAYSWCGKLGVERVYALKDIKERGEITVSYLGNDLAKPRTERQKHI